MAAINELIDQIEDAALRERIKNELNAITKQKKFGLVFEEHLPECTPLYDLPVKEKTEKKKKNDRISDIFVVQSISGETANCIHSVTGD